MRTQTKMLLACLLATSTTAAYAEDRCKLSANRDLDLNLSGVKTLVFDIGPNTLDLKGAAAEAGTVRGKACASDAARLADLVVTQMREGEKLIVRAERKGLLRKGSWSGKDYGDLTLNATVPNTLAVQVKLGSGDARIQNVASLAADVGSGDFYARDVRGMFYADVGSGDIVADGVGGVQIISVGSGDVSVKNVGAGARVGEIGSGDVAITGAKGNVSIDSIGSGDAQVRDIGGDLLVGRVGSGDLDAARVKGGLTVERVGCGSVRHREIGGPLRIPSDD
jgi:hypothetical protein